MKEKSIREELIYIAKLARLPLPEKEKKQIEKDLSEVIEFNMNLLEKIDTEGVEPTAHVGGISSKLRKDLPETGFSQKEALQNAKETHNGFFKVKAILGGTDE